MTHTEDEKPANDDESRGRVVPWLEPSSFEIAAMAKLQAMLPDEIIHAIEASRENPGTVMWFRGLPPEADALLEQIHEDRLRLLSETMARRRPHGGL